MHPPGESMGSIYRVKNLCQGLTAMSHRCFVFLPFNCFEDWGPLVKFITVPVLKSGGRVSKQIYKFIRKVLDIQILSNKTILNPKFFNLSMTQISKILLNSINEENINLDVIIGETEIGGYILYKIKDNLNCPIIVDYQNYWPEELVEHKIIKRNSRRYKYLVNIEEKVINNVDLVITISKSLKKFLSSNLIIKNSSKIKVINNGGLPILDKPKRKNFPPKIINSGMVVQRSNLKLFLKSVHYLKKVYPDIQVYITRKGEKLKETMKLAKEMNLNIDFYWKDATEEFLELLSNCHVGVATSSYDLTRKLGFVAKIYDYLSVGIPIVGNDIGGWSKMISEERVGLLSSNEPEDLANKIIQLIEDQDMSYEYGLRAIELLKTKYSVNNAAQKLITSIQQI